MKYLAGILTALVATAWGFLVLVAFLFASDVFLRRPWRLAVWVSGYVLLALVTKRRPAYRALGWYGAGLIGILLCVAGANFIWPLRNESAGGFLGGRGVVNYILAPWLHVALFLAAARLFPAPPATRPEDAF